LSEVSRPITTALAAVKKWEKEEDRYFEALKKLERKKEGIAGRSIEIKQVVINDLGKEGVIQWGSVDRCESCHVAIDRSGFENEKNPFKTHPHRKEILGKHPISEFGCVTCHAGQGRATEIEHEPFEEGDHSHGIAHHWVDPLKRGMEVQTSCNKCHQNQWQLNFTPNYMAGKKFFVERGCIGCHAVEGFEEMPKAGPQLLKVASKVNPQWLVDWIKDPKGYLPHSKMPKVPLNIDEPGEVMKVASYLVQNSEKYRFPKGNYPGGSVVQGKKIFETVG